MKFIKPKYILITALILALVFLSSSIGVVLAKYTSNSPSPIFKVVIDAGHGGIDGGTCGTVSGIAESEINLEIAKLLKEQMEKSGFEVTMTRTTSAGLYGTVSKGFKKRDMEKRREIIEKANPDIVISIHLNKYTSSNRRGAQVFFEGDNKESKRLATVIQNNFNTLSSQPKNYTALKGDYYILNVSPCPAVICECGFLSNEEDEKLLLTDDFRQKIAEKISLGCIEYLLNL